jgi:imidazoleglycerol-phosphate dehydratase/histidinol-phosphatase
MSWWMRRAPPRVERNTKETRIASRSISTARPTRGAHGLGFFDHMLEQLGKHGGFALRLRCDGDLHIDEHHTVEDCALALGQALRRRWATSAASAATASRRAADGRGAGERDAGLVRAVRTSCSTARSRASEVGDLPTELVPHFFRSLCETAGLNLHLAVRGDNDHHQVEACFKAVARALRQAIKREGALPSTKGVL